MLLFCCAKKHLFSIKITIFVEENKQFKYMARTKKIESTPVRIRFKELENGNKSIYLDIYYEKKRRYEFLKLYFSNSLVTRSTQISADVEARFSTSCR